MRKAAQPIGTDHIAPKPALRKAAQAEVQRIGRSHIEANAMVVSEVDAMVVIVNEVDMTDVTEVNVMNEIAAERHQW